jgi:hypothetical protein
MVQPSGAIQTTLQRTFPAGVLLNFIKLPLLQYVERITANQLYGTSLISFSVNSPISRSIETSVNLSTNLRTVLQSIKPM